MQNPKIKNLIGVIGTAVISTVIITLPMRLLLDRYEASQVIQTNNKS